MLTFEKPKGLPKNLDRKLSYRQRASYRGVVFEFCMKFMLGRFIKSYPECGLSFSKKRQGRLNSDLGFEVDKQGNLFFWEFDEKGRRYTLAEVDGLYEFHDGNSLVPVIFEVSTSCRKDETKIRASKIDLVDELYRWSSVPFLCKIRHTKHEANVSLNANGGDPNSFVRTMLFHRSQHFHIFKQLYPVW